MTELSESDSPRGDRPPGRKAGWRELAAAGVCVLVVTLLSVLPHLMAWVMSGRPGGLYEIDDYWIYAPIASDAYFNHPDRISDPFIDTTGRPTSPRWRSSRGCCGQGIRDRSAGGPVLLATPGRRRPVGRWLRPGAALPGPTLALGVAGALPPVRHRLQLATPGGPTIPDGPPVDRGDLAVPAHEPEVRGRGGRVPLPSAGDQPGTGPRIRLAPPAPPLEGAGASDPARPGPLGVELGLLFYVYFYYWTAVGLAWGSAGWLTRAGGGSTHTLWVGLLVGLPSVVSDALFKRAASADWARPSTCSCRSGGRANWSCPG